MKATVHGALAILTHPHKQETMNPNMYIGKWLTEIVCVDRK